jgi:hypothetical protein
MEEGFISTRPRWHMKPDLGMEKQVLENLAQNLKSQLDVIEKRLSTSKAGATEMTT